VREPLSDLLVDADVEECVEDTGDGDRRGGRTPRAEIHIGIAEGADFRSREADPRQALGDFGAW